MSYWFQVSHSVCINVDIPENNNADKKFTPCPGFNDFEFEARFEEKNHNRTGDVEFTLGILLIRNVYAGHTLVILRITLV